MRARASLQASLATRLGSADEARWMVEEVLGRTGAGAGAGSATVPEPVHAGSDAAANDAATDDAATDAGNDAATDDAARILSDMAARRLAGEPLQYVLGSWAFRTLELTVDARALVPRPETEQVVEVALVEARRQSASVRTPSVPFLAADLGTGTGAIALSVAVELGAADPGIRVVATDVDPEALALAAANVRRVAREVPRVADQVELRCGSWFEALVPGWRGHVRLLVANPPYVSEEEWETLAPEVRREPYGALVAGPGSDGTPGFGAVEAVLAGAYEWLAPGGAVVVEMAPHHAAAASDVAARAGYRDVRVESDLAGRSRAVVGCR